MYLFVGRPIVLTNVFALYYGEMCGRFLKNPLARVTWQFKIHIVLSRFGTMGIKFVNFRFPFPNPTTTDHLQLY